MELWDACVILGVAEGDSEKDVRGLFHDLMRRHHPDVVASTTSDKQGVIDPSLLTEAYAVVLASVRASSDGHVPQMFRVIDVAASPPSTPKPITSEHDGDTIWVEAPPDETYQRLLDAAATIGGIGHVDRNLGLLEVIVRFEGGPSCSVLMTLQGRAHGTDVFCEMESIEAEPAPSILPVLDALLEQLRFAG